MQGDYLFYLDPHVVRPAFRLKKNPSEYTSEEIETCHTMRLRRLHVKDVDPSMMLAFLIRDEKDWENWRHGAVEVQGRPVLLVGDTEPNNSGSGVTREAAVDDVITEDEDEGLS